MEKLSCKKVEDIVKVTLREKGSKARQLDAVNVKAKTSHSFDLLDFPTICSLKLNRIEENFFN